MSPEKMEFNSTQESFSVSIESGERFPMAFADTSETFSLSIHEGTSRFGIQFSDSSKRYQIAMQEFRDLVDAVAYTGEYSVSPDFDGETIRTKNLLMADDVTVLPI